MATLLRPGEGQGATAQDAIERQFDWLRPGDDCFHDVRREEGESKPIGGADKLTIAG